MAESSTLANDTLKPVRDEDIITRILAGETALLEAIMRRYNRRIYRITVAILPDDGWAEDVMQATYVHAYRDLGQSAGSTDLGLWLTRIAVDEALAKFRGAKCLRESDYLSEPKGEGGKMNRFASPERGSRQVAKSVDMRWLLESLVEELPRGNRIVFVLRDVEGMSTEETAAVLNISKEGVRLRLQKARAAFISGLTKFAQSETRKLLSFQASRCDRVVNKVLEQIHRSQSRLN